MMKLSRYFPEESFLVIIMLLAAMLRLWSYGSMSYSNDELSAITRALYPSFRELVSKGFYVDGHPGGIQVLLFYWIKIGGTGAYWVRLPFVVMGIGSVLAAYFLGKRWFHKTTGLFTAAALAFLQYPLLFGRIARPYGPGLLFTILMVLAWTALVFPRKQFTGKLPWKQILFLALTSVACMYTHYFSFLMVIIVGFSGLFFISREKRKPYVITYLIAIVLFIPHITITLNHLSYKGVGEWLGKPGVEWLPAYIFNAFNSSWIIMSMVLGIMVMSLIPKKPRLSLNHFRWLALSWFISVFVIAFLYSLLVNPVLQDSVLLFSFPFLLLLIFSFLADEFNFNIKITLLALLLIGTVDTIVLRKFYTKSHFDDFKGVAQKINDWQLRCGADKVTTTVVANNPFYLNFYLKDLSGELTFAQYDNRGGKDIKALISILQKSKTPYFIHAWTKPEPGEIRDIILNYYPYIIENQNFDDLSEVTLYGKKCFTGMCKQEIPVFEIMNDFETNDLWGSDKSHLSSEKRKAGKYSVKMDSSTEFGPTYTTTVNALGISLPLRIRVDLQAWLPDSLSDASLVIALEDRQGKTYGWAGSDFSLYLDKGKWGPAYFTYVLSEVRSPDDKIAIYVWKPKKCIVYLDNIRIRFFGESTSDKTQSPIPR